MTTEHSQQVLEHLLNSPEGTVYSIEVKDLQRLTGLSQGALERAVIGLLGQGYPITSKHCKIYGFKRIQMNQNYKIQPKGAYRYV
ncbi:hypothetical protein H9650_14235 [Psychrobacillus sp. Sa2BUA9]|uniref:Uncharacterized protein n=1 Tax=Psychrobacillus faecigallinarum TaxID=2762235 RepID=A0ABR8RBW5_9BACI|nr:hypothetical protein [Psychrobacillus faecigallinarum]MBD7945281.1 hypothetical protein [Psychrobacillus faecigallinarum]